MSTNANLVVDRHHHRQQKCSVEALERQNRPIRALENRNGPKSANNKRNETKQTQPNPTKATNEITLGANANGALDDATTTQ